MKLLIVCAVAALIVGGIYHTEVSEYFSELAADSGNSGGAMPVVDSIQHMGNSQKALFGNVNNALGR